MVRCSKPGAEPVPLTREEIGKLGEELARQWLKRQRCKVLWSNYTAAHGGEVDLVCRDRKTLVFLEVKTRTSQDYGDPSEAVNLEKQKLIIRGAMSWLRKLRYPDVLYRFDVVEVILREGECPVVNRIENAFQVPDYYRV